MIELTRVAGVERAAKVGVEGTQERESLREAARQFEALMLRQLYQEMHRTMVGGEQTMAAEFFQDTLGGHLAEVSARQGGIGIAEVLMRAWGVDGESGEPTEEVSLSTAIVRERVGGGGLRTTETSTLWSWSHPLPASRVSSEYGQRIHPISGEERFHHGLDLAAPEGMPIHPVAAGRVVFAGERGGYGNLVEIEHPDGWTTRYAHARELLVQEGDWVVPEQPVATVGQTGAATGPHLHFEARRGARSFDPAHLLQVRRGAEPRR